MKSRLRGILLFLFHPFVFLPLIKVLRLAGLLPQRVTPDSGPPQNILIVNLTEFVGDTVMMLPLIDRLRELVPAARVDVVVSPKVIGLFRGIPELGNVFCLAAPSARLPVLNKYRRLLKMLRIARVELFSRRYSLCLLPRWGIDPEMSAFLAVMTSAARIAGHDPNEETEFIQPFPEMTRLLDCICHGGLGLPEAVRELRLLEAVGLVKELDTAVEEKKPIAALQGLASLMSLADIKSQFAFGAGPYMVLSPGASSRARRWPPERFIAAAKSLVDILHLAVLVIGGAKEEGIGRQIERELGEVCRSVVGRTTLIESTVLLSGSAILIANDSGPAHIGAGLGVPTLVLSPCPQSCLTEFASSPLRVRPVGPAVRILRPARPAQGCEERCIEDEPHCILGITVEDVIAGVLGLLQNDPALPQPLGR